MKPKAGLERLHAAAAASAHPDQLLFMMALDLVDGRAVAAVAVAGQQLSGEDRGAEVSEPHRPPPQRASEAPGRRRRITMTQYPVCVLSAAVASGSCRRTGRCR